MRSLRIAIAATLACLVLAGTATVAQPSPSANDAPTEQLGLTRDEAVALVLATDPRFSDLPDFRRLEIEMTANFDPDIMLGSDYYRVLPTLHTLFSEPGFIDFHYPGNWLIETTLVRDCAETYDRDDPSREALPRPDPCEWRHSWFYRVEPDGTVSLLFDEGDPAMEPAEDE